MKARGKYKKQRHAGYISLVASGCRLNTSKSKAQVIPSSSIQPSSPLPDVHVVRNIDTLGGRLMGTERPKKGTL